MHFKLPLPPASVCCRDAFAKYEGCIKDIQAFIQKAAGKDSIWFMRVISQGKTKEKLEKYEGDLKEAASMLQLTVNVGR